MQQVEDSVQEVYQQFVEFITKMHESQCQTK